MAVYESKNPTKDGRKYFFRIKYKDIFGETHDYTSPKFKNKRDATEEEAKYRTKISNKDTITSSVTFNQIFNEYINSKLNEVKPQSIIKIKQNYKLLKPLENTKVNDFDLKKYDNLKKYISGFDLSINYKNKSITLLKSLISYSNKYYNTSDRMSKFIEKFKLVNEIKKEMDFFTLEEYKKFDSVIDEFDWHVFFEMLYYLGIRKGECQALTFKDIDFKKNTISIKKTLTTKIRGQKWTISAPKTKNSIRVLPLPKKLLEELKIIQKRAYSYNNYNNDWFIFGFAVPFTETTIKNKKDLYCKKANLRQIRIHDFRHSCASLLINNGASIMLVSKYLGHSNITITLNTYTHMYKSELENISNLLDNL